jgi:hypothetical protein
VNWGAADMPDEGNMLSKTWDRLAARDQSCRASSASTEGESVGPPPKLDVKCPQTMLTSEDVCNSSTLPPNSALFFPVLNQIAIRLEDKAFVVKLLDDCLILTPTFVKVPFLGNGSDRVDIPIEPYTNEHSPPSWAAD